MLRLVNRCTSASKSPTTKQMSLRHGKMRLQDQAPLVYPSADSKPAGWGDTGQRIMARPNTYRFVGGEEIGTSYFFGGGAWRAWNDHCK